MKNSKDSVKEPLITFVTRTHNRPEFLEKNRQSVLMQTDGDWERVVLVDELGQGLYHANGMFAEFMDEVHGEYVYILDDDNRLTIPDFVEGVRGIIEASTPDIIMVQATVGPLGILPYPWEQPPQVGKVDGLNFIVERALWRDYIDVYHQLCWGDFYFIDHLFRQPYIEVFWWDKVVAEAMQIGSLVRTIKVRLKPHRERLDSFGISADDIQKRIMEFHVEAFLFCEKCRETTKHKTDDLGEDPVSWACTVCGEVKHEYWVPTSENSD